MWLVNRPKPSFAPGISWVEVNVGEPALEVAPDEAAALFGEVIAA